MVLCLITRKARRKVALITVCSIAIFILCKSILSFMEADEGVSSGAKLFSRQQSLDNLQEKNILMKHFPSYYELKSGSEVFSKCPKYTSCTIDVNEHPSVSYDLVVLDSHGIMYRRPPKKLPGQIWVYFAVESPPNSINNIHDREWLWMFNWTMTYRRDSDIPFGYGTTVWMPDSSNPSQDNVPSHLVENVEILEKARKKRQQMVKPFLTGSTFNVSEYNAKVHRLVTDKTKLAAAFISNCDRMSKRLDYVKMLNRELNNQIDVYGTCGNMRCPKGNRECATMLERDYFFVLAFENSLCKDYITEKTYNILSNYYVVPVVRGGANYSKLTPPLSVIDTSAYKSVKDLARYLLYLSSNVESYITYFSWRREFVVVEPDPLPWCQMCAMLHEGRERVYENVSAWWAEDACFPPTDLH